MSDTLQTAGDPRAIERRCVPRQQVPFACIQLDDDHNGGLILDISERGLSLQAVAILTPEESPSMRFQLLPSEPWIETRGRIAWIGASMKRAGLEFVDLPDEGRDQIRQWISLELRTSKSTEEIALNTTELPTDEPENADPSQESEMDRSLYQNQNQPSITGERVQAPPSAEKVLQFSRAQSTRPGAPEDAGSTAAPLLAWAELEARINREINAHKRTSFPRMSGQLIRVAVGTVLLISALLLFGYYLQKGSHTHQRTIPSAKVPEPSIDKSAEPAIPPVEAAAPSSRPDFMLQVGAMAHKENAAALAEALHRGNFPAFVSPPGTDRFYRVFVGPYSDPTSMLKAKEELKEKGFESIERRGNP